VCGGSTCWVAVWYSLLLFWSLPSAAHTAALISLIYRYPLHAQGPHPAHACHAITRVDTTSPEDFAFGDRIYLAHTAAHCTALHTTPSVTSLPPIAVPLPLPLCPYTCLHSPPWFHSRSLPLPDMPVLLLALILFTSCIWALLFLSTHCHTQPSSLPFLCPHCPHTHFVTFICLWIQLYLRQNTPCLHLHAHTTTLPLVCIIYLLTCIHIPHCYC